MKHTLIVWLYVFFGIFSQTFGKINILIYTYLNIIITLNTWFCEHRPVQIFYKTIRNEQLPGRKGSNNTSALEHNLFKTEAALGFLKSRIRDFFPRHRVSKFPSVFG